MILFFLWLLAGTLQISLKSITSNGYRFEKKDFLEDETSFTVIFCILGGFISLILFIIGSFLLSSEKQKTDSV